VVIITINIIITIHVIHTYEHYIITTTTTTTADRNYSNHDDSLCPFLHTRVQSVRNVRKQTVPTARVSIGTTDGGFSRSPSNDTRAPNDQRKKTNETRFVSSGRPYEIHSAPCSRETSSVRIPSDGVPCTRKRENAYVHASIITYNDDNVVVIAVARRDLTTAAPRLVDSLRASLFSIVSFVSRA